MKEVSGIVVGLTWILGVIYAVTVNHGLAAWLIGAGLIACGLFWLKPDED